VKSVGHATVWVYPFTRSLVHSFTLFMLAAASIAHGAEPFRPDPLKSGLEFSSAEVRALQQDDFSSPAMLWATRGEKLWGEPAGATNKSCAGCHQDARTSMKGVAPGYPKIDPGSARLTNLEGRINLCRTRHQQAAELRSESDELLALTARAVCRWLSPSTRKTAATLNAAAIFSTRARVR
jgi:sulfur-oxidizing protein SoxA